jgi:hypothetical protein
MIAAAAVRPCVIFIGPSFRVLTVIRERAPFVLRGDRPNGLARLLLLIKP